MCMSAVTPSSLSLNNWTLWEILLDWPSSHWHDIYADCGHHLTNYPKSIVGAIRHTTSEKQVSSQICYVDFMNSHMIWEAFSIRFWHLNLPDSTLITVSRKRSYSMCSYSIFTTKNKLSDAMFTVVQFLQFFNFIVIRYCEEINKCHQEVSMALVT